MGDGTGCDNMTAIIVRLDRFLPPSTEDASAETSNKLKRPLPANSPVNDQSKTSDTETSNERSSQLSFSFFSVHRHHYLLLVIWWRIIILMYDIDNFY